MARSIRRASKTGIYHVMMRGVSTQLIFEEPQDYSQFLTYLAEVKEMSKFKLYAYCLMGNHMHLLIKEEGEPLSQIFKRLGARYVYWFNRKYGRSGHLFQDRFKSEAVETDEYLTTILLYIYQNPVKAGLCRHPMDYEWSSRRQLGGCGIVDEDELFGLIPIDTIKEREGHRIECETLEPKTVRSKSISDEDALVRIKSLSGARSLTEFQELNREKQAQVYAELKKQGVSVRQFARLSGLGKNIVERLARKV